MLTKADVERFAASRGGPADVIGPICQQYADACMAYANATNAARIKVYNSARVTFDAAYVAGQVTANDAPAVPNAQDVFLQDTAIGLQFVTQETSVPLLVPPPLPEVVNPEPGTADIDFSYRRMVNGHPWYRPGKHDRAEHGDVVTAKAPDGKYHDFMRIWGAVGPNSGGWEQIA